MDGSVNWQDLHRELRERDESLRHRDEQMRDILEEIRDSLGAMHVRFETLPCREHEMVVKQAVIDITALRERSIDWSLLKRINAKPLVALGAGLAGWLGLGTLQQFLEKWGK